MNSTPAREHSILPHGDRPVDRDPFVEMRGGLDARSEAMRREIEELRGLLSRQFTDDARRRARGQLADR